MRYECCCPVRGLCGNGNRGGNTALDDVIAVKNLQKIWNGRMLATTVPHPNPERGLVRESSCLTHKAVNWGGPGRSRKPTRSGANGIVKLSPFEFLDRLADLVPPPRKHRHRDHGVFAVAKQPSVRRRAQPHPIERSSPVKRMRKCCWPSYPWGWWWFSNASAKSRGSNMTRCSKSLGNWLQKWARSIRRSPTKRRGRDSFGTVFDGLGFSAISDARSMPDNDL